MAKLINKTQGYIIVGQNISMDERLGMKERGLFLTLISLPDNWEFSVLGLSKILPDGKAAIQTAVQRLEKLGYLKRVQAKGERGKFAGYDWEIIPQPDKESPLTENQPTVKNQQKPPLTENRSTDKRSTENPSTENQSQLNIKELNTKKSIIFNNQSINQNISNYEENNNSKQMDRLIDGNLIDEIKEQIDYDALVEQINKEDLNAAVNAIAILKTVVEPQTFGDSQYAADYVRSRADEINSLHVIYVFECFYKSSIHVSNIIAYLKTAFFNAPASMGVYYANAVNSDKCSV